MRPVPFIILLLSVIACTERDMVVVTVNGEISPAAMGQALIHEHMLVDFIGADSTGYHRWDRQEALRVILPYLLDAKAAGINTIIDCTPAFLGRDPKLLRMLADSSGIHILTNTGLYGAIENKYLPAYAYTETAAQLASRWIAEYQDGIENTGIRPGLIKISVGPDSLSPLHEKIVRAAAMTHRATGLAIASHTGPATPAFQQLKVLHSEQVPSEAFIWVHAQNEPDKRMHIEFASRGGWVSLDGLAWGELPAYLEMVTNMRNAGYLDQVLLAHDGGWYSPGEPEGGEFRAFTRLTNEFVPLLLDNGFSREEVDTLLIVNPRRAFSISPRSATDIP